MGAQQGRACSAGRRLASSERAAAAAGQPALQLRRVLNREQRSRDECSRAGWAACKPVLLPLVHSISITPHWRGAPDSLLHSGHSGHSGHADHSVRSAPDARQHLLLELQVAVHLQEKRRHFSFVGSQQFRPFVIFLPLIAINVAAHRGRAQQEAAAEL